MLSLITPDHGPCPVTLIVNTAESPEQMFEFPDKYPVGKGRVVILVEVLFPEPFEL